MKKIRFVVRRLIAEFKGMYKPTWKDLLKRSAKVTGTAAAGAAVLKLVDTGFAALLALIL